MTRARARARRAAALALAIGCAASGAATARAASLPALGVQGDGTAHFSWIRVLDAEASTLLSRAWAPGGTLTGSQAIPGFTGNVFDNAIGVDAGGRETIVYEQASGGDSAPFLRRRDADGSLGPVHRLSAVGADGAAPEVAVEPDGDAVAVWTALSGNGGRRHVLARRISSAGTLGPILTLSSSTWDAHSMQVAVSPNGTAVVVWIRDNPGKGVVMTRAIAAGGTLSPLQVLSYSPVHSYSPDVGVDADGDAVFAWRRDYAGILRIQLRRRSSAGTLSETLTVSPAGDNTGPPDLAVDPTGRAVLTWSQFDGVDYLVRGRGQAANGTLGELRTLSASGGHAFESKVAMDGNGNAMFVWRRFDGAHDIVQSRRRAADGTIGVLLNLSAAGVSAQHPSVGMDAGGNAVAAWVRDPDGAAVLEARRRSATAQLSAIQEIGR